MTIQLYSPIQVNSNYSAGSSGSSGIASGIDKAIKLEQLGKMQRDRADYEHRQSALERATTIPESVAPSETGLNLNIGKQKGEFDPEAYATELDKVNPEAAINYRQARSQHEELKNKLKVDKLTLEREEKAQPLKLKLMEHDAAIQAWDYGKATGWKDKQGVLSIINPYEKDEDKTIDIKPGPNGQMVFVQADGDEIPFNEQGMRYLKASRDTALNQWNEMLKFYETNAKEKINSKVVPRAPNEGEREASFAFVKQHPALEGLPKTRKRAFAEDLAREILSIQTTQKNNKETPMSTDDARQVAWDNLSRRVLPERITKWGDGISDRDAMYFPNKQAVELALKRGEIDESEAASIIGNAFADSPTAPVKKGKEELKPAAKDKKGKVVYLQPSTGKYFYEDGTEYSNR